MDCANIKPKKALFKTNHPRLIPMDFGGKSLIGHSYPEGSSICSTSTKSCSVYEILSVNVGVYLRVAFTNRPRTITACLDKHAISSCYYSGSSWSPASGACISAISSLFNVQQPAILLKGSYRLGRQTNGNRNPEGLFTFRAFSGRFCPKRLTISKTFLKIVKQYVARRCSKDRNTTRPRKHKQPLG